MTATAVSTTPAGAKPTYMILRSGRLVDPFALKDEDIDIRDIAYSLARQARYAGHGGFYSVAEHSVLVSQAVGSYIDQRGADADEAWVGQRYGLIHDNEEAYLQDTIGPFYRKPEFFFKRNAGRALRQQINQRFDCLGRYGQLLNSGELYFQAIVDLIDGRIVADEALQLFPFPHVRVANVMTGEHPGVRPATTDAQFNGLECLLPEPLGGVTLHCWPPARAEYEFLFRFNELWPDKAVAIPEP